jgi:hypothetical protein
MRDCNQGVSREASGLAYGISNCKSQIAKLKSEIWNLRFRAKRGPGPLPRSEAYALVCP